MEIPEIRQRIVDEVRKGAHEIHAQNMIVSLGEEARQNTPLQSGWAGGTARPNLERAFYDVCWDLVREGVLRPGSALNPGSGPTNPQVFAVMLQANERLSE